MKISLSWALCICIFKAISICNFKTISVCYGLSNAWIKEAVLALMNFKITACLSNRWKLCQRRNFINHTDVLRQPPIFVPDTKAKMLLLLLFWSITKIANLVRAVGGVRCHHFRRRASSRAVGEVFVCNPWHSLRHCHRVISISLGYSFCRIIVIKIQFSLSDIDSNVLSNFINVILVVFQHF